MDFDQQTRLAAATSNRLRLLHAELADASPEERLGFMKEEIRRAALALPVHERGAFLAALDQLFPKWEQTVVVQAAAEKPDAKLPREPIGAATLLLSLLPTNPDDPHRRQVVAMLDKAGLIPKAAAPVSSGSAQWPQDRVDKVREKLTIQGPVNLDAARVLDALLILTEFTENLERVVYSTCREAAPDNTAKLRLGDLKKVLNEFLGGSQDTTRGHIATVIQRLRTCTVAIISAPPKVWEQIPERLQHMSPDEIKRHAEPSMAEKATGNSAKAYWRKYEQLSVDLRDDELQKMVREIVRKYVEPIINEK